MIPKIIWQTHESTYDELPDIYKTNSQTYKDLDGWEYRYHSNADREAFITEHFPQYLHLYRYIGPGMYRADFWRYLVLYKYGGFYADIDSRLFYEEGTHFAKTINDPDATFNVVTAGNTPFNNWLILSSKENPIMKDIVYAMISKCREFYSEPYKIFPDASWNEATGPAFYSSIINKHIKDVSYIYGHRDEVYDLGAVHIRPYKHSMDEDLIFRLGER
jgi:mannosyltransferase OCH1-like enzyme